MTKLSIIIPVYNEARYLRRCLDSIKKEDPDDVEIIIIDDGSTDGSADILREYEEVTRQGFDIRTVYHATNWGVAMTRNHGITISKGDFVTFLDADDELEADAVDHYLTGCGADFDVLQFNHRRVNTGGFSDSRYYNEPGRYDKDGELPKKWVLVWNKLFRRSFLMDHVIRFPTGLNFGEDKVFVIRCLRHTDSIYHAKASTVLKHRDNRQSLCSLAGRNEIIRLSEALIRELKEEENDAPLDKVIRQSLVNLWDSPRAWHVFGGES